MTQQPLTGEQRRDYAIARSLERTRAELVSVRQEIADLIREIGWRRARRTVQEAVGRPVELRGVWLLGKRETYLVLEALQKFPRQPTLWSTNDGP